MLFDGPRAHDNLRDRACWGWIDSARAWRCLVRTMSHTSGYNRSRSLLCEGKRAYARIATVCVQSSGVRSGSVFPHIPAHIIPHENTLYIYTCPIIVLLIVLSLIGLGLELALFVGLFLIRTF